MAEQHKNEELASKLWRDLSLNKLSNLDEEVLEEILRLVNQEEETNNKASPPSKGTVPLAKFRIRDEKIKQLMLKTSEKDVFLSIPELADLTGYTINTIYQKKRLLDLEVRVHNPCNAHLISAQSFCKAYFKNSRKNQNSSTVTHDSTGIGIDKNCKRIIKEIEPEISTDSVNLYTNKSSILTRNIKNLMERTSNKDLWLSVSELENLTGYKRFSIYQKIKQWGVTVKRHQACNAYIISAQSFCRGFFNNPNENISDTEIHDTNSTRRDTPLKSNLSFSDLVFQFTP